MKNEVEPNLKIMDPKLRCEVCEVNQFKYKCPACQVKTCCLDCVKKHKSKNQCTGVRDKTAYVNIRSYTDIQLLNDYRFLEEVGRKTDSARRDPAIKGVNSNVTRGQDFKTKLPMFLYRIVAEAKRRGVEMKIMPKDFTKRKENLTRFYSKTNLFCWHIEWLFPQEEAKYKERLDDKCLLKDCIKNFIHPTESDPVIRQKLKRFVSHWPDQVRCYMKVEGRRANSPRYYLLDMNKSIRENLQGSTIVEYPTIHVVTEDQMLHYPVLLDAEKGTVETSSGTSDSETDSDTDEDEVKIENKTLKKSNLSVHDDSVNDKKLTVKNKADIKNIPVKIKEEMETNDMEEDNVMNNNNSEGIIGQFVGNVHECKKKLTDRNGDVPEEPLENLPVKISELKLTPDRHSCKSEETVNDKEVINTGSNNSLHEENITTNSEMHSNIKQKELEDVEDTENIVTKSHVEGIQSMKTIKKSAPDVVEEIPMDENPLDDRDKPVIYSSTNKPSSATGNLDLSLAMQIAKRKQAEQGKKKKKMKLLNNKE